MQIKKAIINASQKLKSKSPSANLDAEILLLSLIANRQIKRDRSWLYCHSDYQLSKSQIKQFQKLINRRIKGQPIAYITGHKEFYKLDFKINKSVMIPRPETEILVEEAISFIGKKKLTVADIGTGCGCIAISIAKNCPKVKIYAVDICRRALAVAQKNAQKHKVVAKIKFIDHFPKNVKFDVIVANLPYLKPQQIKKELCFEPRKALDGGKDGLAIYRKIIPQLKNHLARKYLIILEIDPCQAIKLKRIVKQNLDHPLIKILKDYSNQHRFLKISS